MIKTLKSMFGKKLNVVVLGSDGMLGYDVYNKLIKLASESGSRINIVSGLDIQDNVDVADESALQKWFEGKVHYDICVNCIAYTNTAAAEATKDGRAASYKLNALAALNIARVCRALKTKLIHISTDYVFSEMAAQFGSNSRFQPFDDAFPCNSYGDHKLIGELFIRNTLPLKQYCIMRTSWLYGAHNCKSFVHKFVLNAVKAIKDGKTEITMNNVENSIPTSTSDLADAIYRAITANKYGICHAVSYCIGKSVTRVSFAEKILEYLADVAEECNESFLWQLGMIRQLTVIPVHSETYQPKFSAMRTSCTTADMHRWDAGLKRFISTYGIDILKWADTQTEKAPTL